MKAITSAAKLFERLIPTKLILSVVKTSSCASRGYGYAISDPYWSFSTPVAPSSSSDKESVERLVADGVGAIVVGRLIAI